MTKTENKLWWLSIAALIVLLGTSWGPTYYWLIPWGLVGVWAWVRSDEK